MKIAWFSPLYVKGKNKNTISAWCSELLLPVLRKEHDIDLFIDGFEKYQDYSTYHYLTAYKKDQEKNYDIFFYQIEDSPLCNFTRVHLALKPGVVWFHDFIYSNYGPEPILNSAWSKITEIFNSKILEHKECIFPERGEEYKREKPLAEREAALTPIALFSNPASHGDYLRNINLKVELPSHKKSNSYYLPYPVEDLAITKAQEKIIAFCATPKVEHHAYKLLKALNAETLPYKLIWLLDKEEEENAKKQLAEFGITSYELIINRTPQNWIEILSKATIAVHLHFSVYGQPGLYLALSLTKGLPCITLKFGSTMFLPDDIAFKIIPDNTESEQIKLILDKLLSDGDVNHEKINKYAINLFDINKIASELNVCFKNHQKDLADFMSSWREYEKIASNTLVSEASNYLPEKDLNTIFDTVMKPYFEELGWSKQ